MTTAIQDPILVPLPQVAAPAPVVEPAKPAAAQANDDGKGGLERPAAQAHAAQERTPRPVLRTDSGPSGNSAPDGVENLEPVRLRPRRVIVIK